MFLEPKLRIQIQKEAKKKTWKSNSGKICGIWILTRIWFKTFKFKCFFRLHALFFLFCKLPNLETCKSEGKCDSCEINPNPNSRLQSPSTSLLNGELSCPRALLALRALRAGVLIYSRAWRSLRARVLGVLTCSCASWNGILCVLHKMTCLAYLKLMKCFLDVFDQGAFVNCGLVNWIK